VARIQRRCSRSRTGRQSSSCVPLPLLAGLQRLILASSDAPDDSCRSSRGVRTARPTCGPSSRTPRSSSLASAFCVRPRSCPTPTPCPLEPDRRPLMQPMGRRSTRIWASSAPACESSLHLFRLRVSVFIVFLCPAAPAADRLLSGIAQRVMGLAAFAARYLGLQLPKSKKVILSNWAATQLSAAQVACTSVHRGCHSARCRTDTLSNPPCRRRCRQRRPERGPHLHGDAAGGPRAEPVAQERLELGSSVFRGPDRSPARAAGAR
jgi:hypothetical protein